MARVDANEMSEQDMQKFAAEALKVAGRVAEQGRGRGAARGRAAGPSPSNYT